MEWKSQAGLLYADHVCLMANSEEDMIVIMEKVNECVVEYGLKVNEKTMIVSKLMYGCGVLAWYQRECDDLEVIQIGFGIWLWEVGNVWNELVRGESGWSLFVEREVTCIVDWLLRIVYEESLL